MQLATVPPAAPDPTPEANKVERAALLEKAKSLEASFLSEMLSHAGLGTEEGSFSGGIGEEQFASFLREEQAKAMVQHGGIGLAEHLFQSLVRRDHG